MTPLNAHKGWHWLRLKCKLCGSNQAQNTCTRHFEEKHTEENEKVKDTFRRKGLNEWRNRAKYIRDHYFVQVN